MFVESLKEIKSLQPEHKRGRDKAVATGFPTRKTEAFSYVQLKEVETTSYSPSNEGHTISFSNESFELLTFSQAIEKYGVFITNHYEKMIGEEDSYFSLVNHGWGNNHYFLFFKESIEETISIEEVFSGKENMLFSSLYIFVAAKVKVCLHHKTTVKGENNCVNRAVHIFQEKNSEVTIYETSELEKNNTVFYHTRAKIKKEGNFTHQSGTFGCKTFRNEIKAYLLEERAACTLEGFWNGADHFGIHHLVHCSHLAPYTTSRQHYQGVSDDHARASFEGQIFVDKQAQKTDSYQLSKHLLVGEKSSGFSKPNLEVFADDVKASHGAIVSMLNEEELFYLKSRGISEEKSAFILKRGFLSFFLETIEDKNVYKCFERLIT
jgi:Fe-S cluster assembly protein SufD